MRLSEEELFYAVANKEASVPLTAVKSLVLYDPPGGEAMGIGMASGATLGVILSAPLEKGIGLGAAARRVGIGSLVGGAVGLLLGYRVRERETILIPGQE